MASSTHENHHQHFPPAASGTTSAPPPTPSTTKPNFTSTSDSAATDLLSRLLHRLPPTLSNTPLLLRRRSSLATTTSPPVVPFPELNFLSATTPSVSELGFFQLTDHSITSELARAAESDAFSLLNLPRHLKHQHFPRSWPLGFEDDDEEDTGATTTATAGDSLFLDSSSLTDSSELSLSSLREFTREMEKIGLAVVEALLCGMGLRNPAGDDPDRICSLMWVSNSDDKMVGSGQVYPYVIGLHYQFRTQSCSLLADSGTVSVSVPMDSILVTLGDIAQVWSNGKLKKVRGNPTLSMEESDMSSPLSMSLLVTLPLESTVSPLNPRVMISNSNHGDNEDGDCEKNEVNVFNPFSFEDYAWRVYHERVPLKDPLDRYRI